MNKIAIYFLGMNFVWLIVIVSLWPNIAFRPQDQEALWLLKQADHYEVHIMAVDEKVEIYERQELSNKFGYLALYKTPKKVNWNFAKTPNQATILNILQKHRGYHDVYLYIDSDKILPHFSISNKEGKIEVGFMDKRLKE